MGTGTQVSTGQKIEAAKMNLKLETIDDIGHLPVRWARPGRIYAADGITKKGHIGGSTTSANPQEDGDRLQAFLIGDGSEDEINICMGTGPTHAIWDLWINGQFEEGGYDNYQATYSTINRRFLYQSKLKVGTNIIEMRVNGRNELSTGWYVAVSEVSIQ